MTRLAFVADLHIDSYGQRIDPESGLNARLVDYLSTLRWVVDEAERQDCDALVICGDFTERRHPAPWLVSLIQDALGKAGDTDMDLVAIRGNHDGEIAGGSIVSVLGASLLHDRAFTRPGIAWIGRTAVCAIPFLDRHWLRAQPGMEHTPDAEVFQILSDQIVTIAAGLYAKAQADAERMGAPAEGCVLVLHQTLAGAHMSETQQAFLGDRGTVVDAGRLAAIGFEAVVAGHLHRHQALDGLACPVLYPGSIEKVDFGEEHEAKGFVIAEVGPGRFDWRFVETPARRFLTVTPETQLSDPAIEGAIVRAIGLDPLTDMADLRRCLERAGAFEVDSMRKRPVAAVAAAGALAEALSPAEALSEYFRDDPDAVALIDEGRRLLAEVA